MKRKRPETKSIIVLSKNHNYVALFLPEPLCGLIGHSKTICVEDPCCPHKQNGSIRIIIFNRYWGAQAWSVRIMRLLSINKKIDNPKFHGKMVLHFRVRKTYLSSCVAFLWLLDLFAYLPMEYITCEYHQYSITFRNYTNFVIIMNPRRFSDYLLSLRNGASEKIKK